MTELLALATAAVISVTGALISAFYAHRLSRENKMADDDRLAFRFREPLLQAAFNLQSRIFNIVRQDFLGRFLIGDRATPDEREYAVNNTAFLIGQYLAWVEILRCESQYMDPRSRARDRAIVESLEHIRDTFAESEGLDDPVMRLFRGEQRAIGEVMLVATNSTTGDLPRWESKGYARFVGEHDVEQVQRWFRRVENDIATLAKEPEAHDARLVRLQNALIDLIEVLDPEGERVPQQHRQRL
jgi:hypothetical protein